MPADKQPFATIDEYIATFPPEVQAVLERLRETVREAVPEVTEAISYGMPTFNLDGKYMVYFAGFKRHVSLFPRTLGMEAHFGEELAPYSSGKGTLQFPLSEPIPDELVKRIAAFRAMERREKKR